MFNLNKFESSCCKGLGIVLIILLTIISFQLVGCTSVVRHIQDAEWKKYKAAHQRDHDNNIKGYPLLDTRGVLHKYRDNFKSIVFPTHNKKLTQYCGIHFQWEVIKEVWKQEGDEDFRWHYIVIRDKKQ